jgi:predicted TIM-barrel enzyme
VVKDSAGAVPVFVNTGVRAHNAADQLAIADGAIVGTYFKQDGVFENRAVASRVGELMGAVKEFRTTL